jgi:nicotinate phosphoribosyltransferase
MLHQLYRHSLALLTDLYQLTMAYGYWHHAMHEREAVFHLFYRKNPFQGEYAVAAGLDLVADYLADFHFDDEDLAYLATLQGNDGKALFHTDFLAYLKTVRFDCDVMAVPEGSVVFPHAPLLRIRGPLLQCQLVETPLLNIINFQTLIASKAARVCQATGGDPVLEFGLRRAQGIDGALAASRAAYIGGCAATSNVLAGKLYGIPVKGTHAHSWVMSFDDEMESFERYAQAMPNNCIFLVDTYDTLEGVRNAIAAGLKLRQHGHEMVGIRLDSGDLAELSSAARKLMDDAGFPNAAIVASNDLDEYAIADLKQRGASIGLWGVGTKLVTAYDQPALGGVYKLSAIKNEAGAWQYRLKCSNDAIKVSNPGALQVRRFPAIGDVMYDELSGTEVKQAVPLTDTARMLDLPNSGEDLLQPVFRDGKRQPSPSLDDIRNHARTQLTRFQHVKAYQVGLERSLHERKMTLMGGAV